MYRTTQPGERGRVTDLYAREEQVVLGGGDYMLAPGARLMVGPHGGMYETLGADRGRSGYKKATDFLSAKDRKLWKQAKKMEMMARANPMLKRSKKYKKLHRQYVRLKRALATYQKKLDEARARMGKRGKKGRVYMARPGTSTRRRGRGVRTWQDMAREAAERLKREREEKKKGAGLEQGGVARGQSTDPCAPYYTGTAQCDVPPDVPTDEPDIEPPMDDEGKLPGEPLPDAPTPSTGGGGLLPPSPGRPYGGGVMVGPGTPSVPTPKVGRPDFSISPMPGTGPALATRNVLLYGGAAAAGVLVLYALLRKRS